jgi:3-oxoacyl-[acyl-carrier protein] reductase
MTKALAKELGRRGIRVNAVASRYTVTQMMANVPEKVLKMMKTPLCRLDEPKDIAYGYPYLAFDEAEHVTGAVLSVDGGLKL